jgi:hypothetical protein
MSPVENNKRNRREKNGVALKKSTNRPNPEKDVKSKGFE